MRCPHCNQEHSNQAVFCPVTGNQIVAFECPSCGQVVMAGSAFCSYCGFDLAADALPAPRPPRRVGVFLAAVGGVLAVAALAWFVLPRLLGQAPSGGTNHPPGTGLPATLSETLTAIPTSPTGIQATEAATLTPSPAQAGAAAPECTSTGQTWLRPQDGMQMVCVPAGSFTIGMKTCDFIGCAKEVNGGSVDLAAFWIDQSEVTNTDFERFVTATGYLTGAERSGYSEVSGITSPVYGADWRHPQGPDSTIDTLGDHPVVQVDWFAAAAYCQWAGGSLPSEAQWEKAARGTDGRLFPWGNDMPAAPFLNAADASLPVPWASASQDDGYHYTAPVGSFPEGNSPYGAEDMAGNVWEWTRSLLKDYPYQAGDGREVAAHPLADPPSGSQLVLRGGSWYSDYGSVRSTLRASGLPGQAQDAIGFRCVYP
jgi:formylglycine-generating enzyme required for sulfatase activity